tara:strand:+ start:4970 stop:5188 length:219 start_codon:yes stop_codon:yes gene_type:complete
MGNFVVEYEKGQKGGNEGIPLGPGLINVSNAINGVQKGRIYVIAAPPKAKGKWEAFMVLLLNIFIIFTINYK